MVVVVVCGVGMCVVVVGLCGAGVYGKHLW